MKKERHLTPKQRENIATDLKASHTGPVCLTAPSSDKEAVSYEAEIADVLEDTGCKVEIDNAHRTADEQEIPTGVEMTIAETTVQPIHASRIVRAFRHAGVFLATRINAKRGKNDTLYVTVGQNDTPETRQ